MHSPCLTVICLLLAQVMRSLIMTSVYDGKLQAILELTQNLVQIAAKIKAAELMPSVTYHMEITPLTNSSCSYQCCLDNALLLGNV